MGLAWIPPWRWECLSVQGLRSLREWSSLLLRSSCNRWDSWHRGEKKQRHAKAILDWSWELVHLWYFISFIALPFGGYFILVTFHKVECLSLSLETVTRGCKVLNGKHYMGKNSFIFSSARVHKRSLASETSLAQLKGKFTCPSSRRNRLPLSMPSRRLLEPELCLVPITQCVKNESHVHWWTSRPSSHNPPGPA